MASRRRAREYALQALYDADLSAGEAESALDALWQALLDGEGLEECRPAEEEEMAFAGQLVRGVIARITCRVDAGRTTESVDLEPGVVSDCGQSGVLASVTCLQYGILDESGAGFGYAGDAEIALGAECLRLRGRELGDVVAHATGETALDDPGRLGTEPRREIHRVEACPVIGVDEVEPNCRMSDERFSFTGFADIDLFITEHFGSAIFVQIDRFCFHHSPASVFRSITKPHG